ncbi:MAG: PEP-CTERM sorting domain-containing protein [Candidatus Sulfotelmatobacter sp.]
MSPVQGMPASRTKAPILTLSLMVLGLSLFFVSAARADTWSAGAFTTYDQTEWGDSAGSAGMLLQADYGSVYSSTGDLFHIGIVSPGFFLEFTSAFHLDDFLPANGTPGSLNTNLANPTTTSAGIFAGEVAGLKLNVDFSAAGLLPGTSGLHFGDLVLAGMTGADSGLNGLTVSQFLSLTEQALGGADTGFTFLDLDIQLAELNNAFDDGQPESFAQDHLVAPGSSMGVPEPPTLLLAALGLLAAATFRRRQVT